MHNSFFGSSQEVSLGGERYQNCLREIRSRGNDVVDEKNGIVIKKEDWHMIFAYFWIIKKEDLHMRFAL